MFFFSPQTKDVVLVDYHKSVYLGVHEREDITFCEGAVYRKNKYFWGNPAVYKLNKNDVLPQKDCDVKLEFVGRIQNSEIKLDDSQKTKIIRHISDYIKYWICNCIPMVQFIYIYIILLGDFALICIHAGAI